MGEVVKPREDALFKEKELVELRDEVRIGLDTAASWNEVVWKWVLDAIARAAGTRVLKHLKFVRISLEAMSAEKVLSLSSYKTAKTSTP